MADCVFTVEDYRDEETGLTVRRLTDSHAVGAHCHLLYFNMRYYSPDGGTLFFGMNRDGERSFWRMGLEPEGGKVTADCIARVERGGTLCSSVDPKAEVLYFTDGGSLFRIPTGGGERRKLHTVEDGWGYALMDVASGGGKVMLSTNPRVKTEKDLGGTYGTFRERFEKMSESAIIEVDVETGDAEELVHPPFWVSHLLYRPHHPEMRIFCREGPWIKVGNRLHLVTGNGEFREVRVQHPKEALGHEFWLADGSALGYHGRIYMGEPAEDPTVQFIGLWYPESEKYRDWVLASPHFHTQVDPTGSYYISDGSAEEPYINRIDLPDAGAEAVVARLAVHDGTWDQAQEYQPHPTVNPDGRSVLFNSNRRDMNCDIYQVFTGRA